MSDTSFPPLNNAALLTTALTHRSALNERLTDSAESNERLEFLGDAVLELIITEDLYAQYPKEQEGMLTAYRSALVKTTSLAEVAETLQLGERLVMSRGEEASGGRTNPSLLANTVEALIGALYLDQGYTACQTFVRTHIWPKITDVVTKKLYKDAKSHLQEVVQAQGHASPEYIVIAEVGPDHNREFEVEVRIDGLSAGRGKGRSKQQGQTAAAQAALDAMV